MQATSVPVLESIQSDLTLAEQVHRVISTEGPITNLEISEVLGRPINVITPSTNKLVHDGVVAEAYRAPSPITGRQSIFWGLA